MTATATFFRRDGRLRVKLVGPWGTKEFWMERAGTDHRYKFGKVTGLAPVRYANRAYQVSQKDYARLQTAQEGDVVEFEVMN